MLYNSICLFDVLVFVNGNYCSINNGKCELKRQSYDIPYHFRRGSRRRGSDEESEASGVSMASGRRRAMPQGHESGSESESSRYYLTLEMYNFL